MLRLASLERATDFVFCFVRGLRRRRSVPRRIEHTGDWSRSCNDNQYSDLFDLFIIGRRSDRAKRQRALFTRGINDEDGNCVHRTNVSALFFFHFTIPLSLRSSLPVRCASPLDSVRD